MIYTPDASTTFPATVHLEGASLDGTLVCDATATITSISTRVGNNPLSLALLISTQAVTIPLSYNNKVYLQFLTVFLSKIIANQKMEHIIQFLM